MVAERLFFHRTRSASIIPNKRGQLTVFIIIGIVILFVSAGILFISQKVVKESLTTEGEPVIEDVPATFKPLQVYTENCLSSIGKQGLITLGEQGGYIYPDLVGKYSSSNPTDSDGLNLEPIKVPYWYYNLNSNIDKTVHFATLQPKLHTEDDPALSIEAQLARYVQENLQECLGEYNTFNEQGFTISSDPHPEVTIKIGSETVNVWLKMNLKASKGSASVELTQFYIKIPLPLKKYYDLAQGITQQEQNKTFLENVGLNVLEIYAQPSADKLPPTQLVTFEPVNILSWSTKETKDKITSLLTSNIPLIRYQSSKDFYRFQYPQNDFSLVHQQAYDDFILPLNDAHGTEVSFDYFAWTPYLDINEGQQTIKPTDYALKSPLPVIPFHFNFQKSANTYDLAFPTLVTIRDPTALGGEGYSFSFALEANIINNFPAQPETITPLQVSTKKTMACDDDKRNTQLVKTIVVDSYTKEPLDLVKINLNIPEQDSCTIGLTNSKGELTAHYPALYGGVTEFLHDDYIATLFPADTYEFKEKSGIIGYAVAGFPVNVIEMDRYKPIDVTIEKKSLQKCIEGLSYQQVYEQSALGKSQSLDATGTAALGAQQVFTATAGKEKKENVCFAQGLFTSTNKVLSYIPTLHEETHTWSFVNVAQRLEDDEQATLILRRVRALQPGGLTEDFSTVVRIRGHEKTTVSLVPGVYEVTAFLTKQKPLLIPAEQRCTTGLFETLGCFDVNGCCSTFNELRMDKVITGQLEWSLPTTHLTILPENLYSAQQLTFFLPTFDPYTIPELAGMRVIEDSQALNNAANLSVTLRASLEPQFS